MGSKPFLAFFQPKNSNKFQFLNLYSKKIAKIRFATQLSIATQISCNYIGKYAFRTQYGDKIPIKQVEVPKNCKIGNKAFDDDCKVIRK